MYRKIENNPFFEDIKCAKAKENFDKLVDYLCSMPVAEAPEEDILLDGDFYKKHKIIANSIYSPRNRTLIEKVLKERTKTDTCDSIDGSSYIYELGKDKILKLGTTKYYRSISVLEHELTHIVMSLNNNNPKPQYNEILSFFVEFLSLLQLSKMENNPNIYNNAFINRCVARMSFRVFAHEFSDEYLNEHSNFLNNSHHNSYPYMLGFIYSVRLLDIYEQDKTVLKEINDILEGTKSIDELLKEYNISLENSETINCFINMCNYYSQLVTKKYTQSKLHSVR